MSRLVIGSRAALIAALRAQVAERGGAATGEDTAALTERARALAEDLFLDALFIVAQFPGGQVPEAEKCCYAFDVRHCAGLCTATWREEAFWSGLVRVQHKKRLATHLMAAAHKGDAARVRWLLARGAPLDARDSDSWTALHWAAANGNADAAGALVAAGACLDTRSKARNTPLYWAAQGGHVAVVRVLVGGGADVEARGFGGLAPLHNAARAGHADVVAALLDAGADVNAGAGAKQRTPLALASGREVRELLEARGGVAELGGGGA